MGKETRIGRNNAPRSSLRIRCSYIQTSFPLNTMCTVSFNNPSFLRLSPPPVDFLGDLLDTCPIRIS